MRRIPTMLGVVAIGAAAALAAQAPQEARSTETQASAAKANAQAGDRTVSRDASRVDVGQRWRPSFPTLPYLPKSKNPPTKKLRGRTNKRKASLKAKQRRRR